MLLLWLFLPQANAQQYFRLEQKRVTMHFNFIRNMIVVPLTINDKGPYNFILDTGVDLMIITDPALVDSLNITNKRLIRVTGMGEGNDFEAYLTSALKVSMPNVIGEHISAAILKKDEFGLSNYAGINIHGLLGYEFFSSFSVRVNFMDSTITMASPRDMRLFKRGDKIQMSIEDHKPYITSRISISGKTPEKENKLILDLGAGHPLSLENLIGENKGLPEKFIASNLGISLTGPINGFLSRIDQIEIGKYRITNVITSFPDYDTVKKNLIAVKRNGNLGMEILKKFNLIIDYQNGILYLKPNLSFKDQFEHDMSGMEYFADGPGLTHIIINNVERGSAAAEIGLKKGDELVKINFVPVERMGIEQIDHVFRSRENRSVLLEVFHDNIYEKFILTLKRRI